RQISQSEDGLGQGQIVCLTGFGEFVAQGIEGRFQARAANITGASDDAGGPVAGIENELHAADAAGHGRGEVDAAVHRVDDDVAGGDQRLRLSGASEQGGQRSGGKSLVHDGLHGNGGYWTRMASASSRSLATSSGCCSRIQRKAASRRAPWSWPALATKLAASSRASTISLFSKGRL